MGKTLKINRVILALLAGVSLPAVAYGQEADADDSAQEADRQGGIKEIIVTAQKRAENVQDVPIAISAFAGDALQERNVADVSQLATLSPNVSLDSNVPFSGSTAVLAASIRGIGSNDFAFNIDPGVGIYIDGVYLARSVGANQDLLDIERIEVLKGPQGTLFGRNTIGGAVSLVTADPDDTFSGRGDFTIGRFNLMHARGTVNVPLSESLFASASFAVKSRDGYGKRIAFPSPNTVNQTPFTAFPATGFEAPRREGDEENRTFRSKLKFDNGGALRVTVGGDYQRNKSTAPNTLVATISGTNPNFGDLYNLCITSDDAALTAASGATGLNLNNLCGSFGTQFPSVRRDLVTPVTQVFGLAGRNADANPNNDLLLWGDQFITGDPDLSYANGNNFSELTNWGLTMTADLELSSTLDLKSITAYREGHWLSGLDADGSPINILHTSFDQDQWQFSQEFQLAGTAFDDTLNYVFGAYYFKEKGTLLDVVTFAEGMNQVDGPNWLQTENYAAFGQVDWRPIELVGITIGGRVTHEKKLFEGGQQELNGLFYKLAGCSDTLGNVTPDAPIAGPGSPSCREALGFPDSANPLRIHPEGINRQTFNDFSPKVGVQIYPADDIMLYGSWSRGYKTGGWTTRFTTPQTTVANFDPEEASTFEIGVKSTLLDRRLQVNAAAFTTEYTDIQLNFQVGTSPTIDNVGDARIRGFELEVVAAPIDILTINASVGYLDAFYTRLDPAVAVASGPNSFQAGAVVGGPLPKSPEWKFNLSPRLEVPVGEGRLIVLADWTRTSSQWSNVERTLALRRPSTDNVSASVTYKPADDRYSFAVGGTNLTDDRYIVGGTSIPASGVVAGVFSRPREWYARIGFEF